MSVAVVRVEDVDLALVLFIVEIVELRLKSMVDTMIRLMYFDAVYAVTNSHKQVIMFVRIIE